jgi:hypothetical protein
VLNRAIQPLGSGSLGFGLVPVVRRTTLDRLDEKGDDLAYWLSKAPVERVAAVTLLVQGSLEAVSGMNKKMLRRKKLGS